MRVIPRYPDIKSASEAAQRLKITGRKEYQARYKEAPRLPSNPQVIYKQHWTGWADFLGKGARMDFYPDIQEAREAALRLKIISGREYKARYKEDPPVAVKSAEYL